jgi:hypothetical protein
VLPERPLDGLAPVALLEGIRGVADQILRERPAMEPAEV